MNKFDYPLLSEVEPQLVATLKRLLSEAGETLLAGQVGELSIVERHDGKYGCDYYMVPRPDEPWGPGHRTLGLSPGALHVDVLGEKIVCVEVLWGPSRVSRDIETT